MFFSLCCIMCFYHPRLFQSMRRRISSRETFSRSSSQHTEKQQQQQQQYQQQQQLSEPPQQQETATAPAAAVAAAAVAATGAERAEAASQGFAAGRNCSRDRLLQVDSIKAHDDDALR